MLELAVIMFVQSDAVSLIFTDSSVSFVASVSLAIFGGAERLGMLWYADE
jgi:hypothetical protein